MRVIELDYGGREEIGVKDREGKGIGIRHQGKPKGRRRELLGVVCGRFWSVYAGAWVIYEAAWVFYAAA